MSDRTDPQRVTRALESLADTFAAGAVPPPAAGLRARATRRLRLRRTTTALTAAAGVAALAIGGAHAIDLAVPPPVPPAGTPTPTDGPSPTTGPSPTPPPIPPVTPSPRPAPLAPQAPPDDPITEVDWFTATITLPDSEFCPAGQVQFAPFETEVDPPSIARVHADGMVIDLLPESAIMAYGDVTGDGRIEVILAAQCFLSSTGTDFGSGHGTRLLAVAQAANGTLTGLGFLGPDGSDIHEVWVADDGRVLMVGDPWTVNPEEHFPAIPGLVLSYRWDGAGFVGWEPAQDYPPIVPLDPSGVGPPVRPRAVAAGLGCPDVELRFRPYNGWGGTATAAGATFVIATGSFQQYLFDLDHTGDRLLVVTMACTGPDGWTREGLAVFERAGDGWQGISVLPPPPGLGLADAGDWVIDADGAFVVRWARQIGEGSWDSFPQRYRWTGTVFEVVQ